MDKYILYIFLLLLGHTSSFAQAPKYIHLTDKDGLPSMTVYDVLQDSKGFIWVGTESGLCKYDGYTFKKYKVPNANGSSFSILSEDKYGRIYFMNFANQLFYIENDTIKEMNMPFGNETNTFLKYIIDQEGNLYMSTDNVYIYNRKQEKWSIFYKKLRNHLPSISFFCLDTTRNELWTTHELGGMIKINTKTKKTTKINTPSIYTPGSYISSIDIIKNHLYLSSRKENEIIKLNVESLKISSIFQERDLKSLSSSYKIYYDRNQNIWLATPYGAYCYDKYYRPLNNGLAFLKNKYISQLMQDREGNYWFTTLSDGVFVLRNKDIQTYKDGNSFMTFNHINCLTKDHNNNIYIGGNANEYIKYNTAQRKADYIPLNFGDVECMYYDKENNNVLVENNFMVFHDAETGEKEKIIKMGASPKEVTTFGNYYLFASGHMAGVSRRNSPVLFFSSLQKNKLNAKSGGFFRAQRSRCVFAETEKNRAWVGYADGLYYYNGLFEGKEFKTTDNKSIIALDINKDKDNNIWVGTAEQGIFVIKDLAVIKHYTTSKGLVSNHCKVIKFDQNKAWIGTNLGLQVLDLKSHQFEHFSQEDGLVSNEIKDILIDDKNIWLASAKGLSSFNKNIKRDKSIPPNIYIEDFIVNDSTLNDHNNIQLDYYENDINITFVGLAFNSFKNFKYKYRLIGLNNNWISVDHKINFVRYPSLPPGEYTFEVKVVNRFGVESTQSAKIAFFIAKPFWQKWWFFALMALLIVAAASLVFRVRINAIQRKNRLEKEVLEANLKALKVQMNPHFIYNTLSSIQNYMLKSKKDDADRYLSKFAKLTRQVLENSRQDFVTIEEEVSTLKNYLELEQFYAEKEFSYTLKVDPALDRYNTLIPPLFAQPFIENAIKHGISLSDKAGKIDINFSFLNELVLIEIKDNGVGREKSRALRNKSSHKSLSTKITEERMKIFRETINKAIRLETKDIFDETHTVTGTCVKLYLPYQYEDSNH